MKKIIIILIMVVPAMLQAQQLPLTESYLVDPYILSSAYAGVHNSNTLLANYIFHASYLYHFSETWSFKPFTMFRAGRDIPSQFELAVQAFYRDKFLMAYHWLIPAMPVMI